MKVICIRRKGKKYMDIFDMLSLIGGLCLFLFGMNIMGKALERRAGDRLRSLLEKMTSGRLTGFAAGCGITAIIQSSSATTVMVVGFVNSELMSLRQAINVIMGSNVGTTITAWILSLSGISSDNLVLQLLKPTSFVPVVALIGTVMLMAKTSDKTKDTATILLGFATLMFGMDTMSSSVSGLAEIPEFQQILTTFENPILGVLAGAAFTAVIQSSSAAVGVVQVLAMTGQMPYGSAIPIIMGTCIGTCVTAVIAAIGTKREAQQAAMAHLTFNVLGSVIWIIVYMVVKSVISIPMLGMPASLVGIALINTGFNVLTAAIFLPMPGVLERIVLTVIPNKVEAEPEDERPELDERLLVTPSIALEHCEDLATEMARVSRNALLTSLDQIKHYTPEMGKAIRDAEERTDQLEDVLGSFLVRLSSSDLSNADNERITFLLKSIGDYERIADHAVNILESAEEIVQKGIEFTDEASHEMKVITNAVREVIEMATRAYLQMDLEAAKDVEPLEQVIDDLKEQLRTRHIERMKSGNCSVDAGYVWLDILTDLERCSDHCSNIAGSLMDTSVHTMHLHETLRAQKELSASFSLKYQQYQEKYRLAYTS